MDEANKLKACDSSPVHLSEDNGDAMEVILCVLHHDTSGLVIPTDLEIMASVALHCDKYDCYSILRPCVAHWLLHIRQVKKTATTIGLQLFIAFNLRDSNYFSKTFAQASTNLSCDFVSNGKIMTYSTFYRTRSWVSLLIPFSIDESWNSPMAAELSRYVDDMTHEVQKKIEGVEASLR